ncbi:cytidine deaminase [Spiroplasma alleghenense]|uniref:Cytidine deaminase n=1 Tax=Spiroplasma alleghenense TaxID=216931 RepID=A0A345Z3C2_9MOLU|nr:cytidine deaminase [Spiroplasma alleghenense]AXK51101.1 cytidine deaminase [Spiroplasma alleghenense]
MSKEITFKKLKNLLKNSYVPYSKFPVSCIVKMKNGQEIFGVNVENASYPAGICAERVALPQIFALGLNEKEIEKISIMTSSTGFGSPCGICRQFISEIIDNNVVIEMFNINKHLGDFKIDDFLPFQFSSEELK